MGPQLGRGVAVYTATNSTLAVGLVSVAQFGPLLLLTPMSGAWADRGNLKRQLMGGRILCFMAGAPLAGWFAFFDSKGWTATLVVLAGSFVLGLGFVIGGPALQSVIPAMVTRQELGAAMTLNTIPNTAARFVGPALGAVIVAHSGPAVGFAAGAFSHLIFAAALLAIRVPASESSKPGIDYSLRAGLRHVWSDRPLLLLLTCAAAVSFGTEPTLTLAPALGDQLGGGTTSVGLLSTSFGLGAVIGLLGFSRLSRAVSMEKSVGVGLGFIAGGIAVSAVAAHLAPAMVGFGLAGVGFSVAVTSVGTAVQLRVHPPSSADGYSPCGWSVSWG